MKINSKKFGIFGDIIYICSVLNKNDVAYDIK